MLACFTNATLPFAQAGISLSSAKPVEAFAIFGEVFRSYDFTEKGIAS